MNPVLYIDYTTWLCERNIIDRLSRDDKIYFVDFKDKTDALAFKLRFGL